MTEGQEYAGGFLFVMGVLCMTIGIGHIFGTAWGFLTLGAFLITIGIGCCKRIK